MTIKEFILSALEYKPLHESVAQKIILRILEILSSRSPKGLPAPKNKAKT